MPPTGTVRLCSSAPPPPLPRTSALFPTDSLAFSFDYQGNAPFLPDVPLPGLQYIHTGKTLRYTLGFPTDSITWTPLPQVTLEVRCAVPYTGFARAAYQCFPGFSLYTSCTNFFEGFQPSNDHSNHRIFFQMCHAEAGLRYVYRDWFDVTLDLGYAFDQDLSRGFDVRDLSPVGQLSDRPYAALIPHGIF